MNRDFMQRHLVNNVLFMNRYIATGQEHVGRSKEDMDRIAAEANEYYNKKSDLEIQNIFVINS